MSNSAGLREFLEKPEVLAVDPQVEERVDAVKVDEDLAAVPTRRDCEVTPVGADGVAIHERGEALGRFAHHARPVAFEQVGLVGIHGHVVPLSLPGGRHGDFLPAGDVEPGLEEAGRALFRALHPVELPGAVEGHAVLRKLGQDFLRAFDVGVGVEGRARFLLVEAEPLLRFPLLAGGGFRGGGLRVVADAAFAEAGLKERSEGQRGQQGEESGVSHQGVTPSPIEAAGELSRTGRRS